MEVTRPTSSSSFDLPIIQHHPAFKWSMLLQLFVGNIRLSMPKTSLDFVFFYDVNQNLKKRRFLRFLAFYDFLANLLGNKRSAFVICDWWISIRFVCFCVSRLDALFLKSFTLALRFFLSSLHWNMASLDFKGEIVPIELPNPEETQLRKGENEPVRSRWHSHLLTNTVDATVTVWLTSQKNLNLEHAQYELLRMSAEVPSSSRLI